MTDAEQALRQAAYDIEAELICCDVWERRALNQAVQTGHLICYWAGAARAIVLEHADRHMPIGTTTPAVGFIYPPLHPDGT